MAKIEMRNHALSGDRKAKWWEWLAFAAVLELFVPERNRNVEWWDWVVWAAVISSALL